MTNDQTTEKNMINKAAILGVLAVSLVAMCVGFGGNAKAQEAKKSTANDSTEKEDSTKVDKDLLEYEAKSGISGNIKAVGSDTLNNLMALWATGFKDYYPNIEIVVDGKGSSTAPPALIDGTSDIGPMSRKMKSEEIDKFEKKFGYKPSYVAVAIDALAVYVNKDNPIESLSLKQIDAIFSKTRKGGHAENITKWGQVGLDGDWENLGVTMFGRNAASGTYGYFKKKACFKGDLQDSLKEQPGSAAVIQSTGTDRGAISYSGVGYKTAAVKFVNISKKGGDAYAPTAENCYSRKYPLSRYLYIYFNRAPGKDVKPLIKEFFTYVNSKGGQTIVMNNGYIPLKQEHVEKFAKTYNSK
ncbi:MAG: phosphate ABC transporter substrate-binding protein [Planctomycetes bacterium]|nr:phosphate ABC transporter substrate-binding protein [Planctomycetota bacterium]